MSNLEYGRRNTEEVTDPVGALETVGLQNIAFCLKDLPYAYS